MPTDPRPDWVLTRRQQIGHHIARLRAEHGLTLDGLAAAAGVSRDSVLRAEHATRSTGLDVILQIARGLGVPPGSLLDVENPAADTGGVDDGA